MRSVWMVVWCMAGCERELGSEGVPQPRAAPVEQPPISHPPRFGDCKVNEGEVFTTHRPDPAAVAAMLSHSYRVPKLLEVTMHPRGGSDIVDWKRTYDGVPVDAHALSVRVNDGWCTRFKRELGEPARVRRANLIAPDDALAKAGLARAKVELVHRAFYGNQQKPGTVGNNAADYDHVLEHTELLYVVSTSMGEEVHVDPYSGAIRRRIEPSGCFGRRK